MAERRGVLRPLTRLLPPSTAEGHDQHDANGNCARDGYTFGAHTSGTDEPPGCTAKAPLHEGLRGQLLLHLSNRGEHFQASSVDFSLQFRDRSLGGALGCTRHGCGHRQSLRRG